jgi:hypothetical protein
LDAVLVLDINQFFIFFPDFSQGGELANHTVGLFKLGAKMADLLFIHLDDFMQILELSLHGQMRMFIGVLGEFFDQPIHLFYFLLILLLLEEKCVLFQQEQVDSIQSLEIVVGRINELVAVVHGFLF